MRYWIVIGTREERDNSSRAHDHVSAFFVESQQKKKKTTIRLTKWKTSNDWCARSLHSRTAAKLCQIESTIRRVLWSVAFCLWGSPSLILLCSVASEIWNSKTLSNGIVPRHKTTAQQQRSLCASVHIPIVIRGSTNSRHSSLAVWKTTQLSTRRRDRVLFSYSWTLNVIHRLSSSLTKNWNWVIKRKRQIEPVLPFF